MSKKTDNKAPKPEQPKKAPSNEKGEQVQFDNLNNALDRLYGKKGDGSNRAQG